MLNKKVLKVLTYNKNSIRIKVSKDMNVKIDID